MEVVSCYQMYLALKLHFESPKYDYIKYGGKVKLGDINKRKDKFQFQKLCRLVDMTEMQNYMVANFASATHKLWIGDLLDPNAKEVYNEYIKKQQSITYIFGNELDQLLSGVGIVSDLFKIDNGQNPAVLDCLLAEDISIETFILLNYFIQFFDKFDKLLTDDLIWPKVKFKCQKLLPFMIFDKSKIATVLKNKTENFVAKA